MATSPATVDAIVNACSGGGEISAKRMFGEYGLFSEGKMFAIVGDDQFFLKKTNSGVELYPEAVEAAPYPGAKPYLLIPESKWTDTDWLAELVTLTVQEIPAPKPKKAKRP